ncbi:MAG TPA: beta-propeller fold lactonase family protein [Actinomycetota bacterium]|jgi:6-phosphogluconolactonase (cycloisomerase 2 family)
MQEDMMGGRVYVQTNEPQNQVVAFRRSSDGSLEEIGSYPTGGKGDGVPHLTSQGSLVLTGDGKRLLVTNAGGDDAGVFDVTDEGLELRQTVATPAAPKSVTEHDGVVYVLGTAEPSLAGFRMSDASLTPIDGSARMLPADSSPAQVGFTPSGDALIVTQRGTDSIVAFPVNADGTLGEPTETASSGPTPYGFAFTSRGVLVVTEAFRAEKGAAAASSYLVNGTTVRPVTGSVGNGRSEICWAVVKDDRFAFTTNFADGAVSRYAIAEDGSLSLEDAVAGTSVEGHTGLRDEDLSGDGAFLYAIDADAGKVFGWSVGDDGSLMAVGSWGMLPATASGLAAS